MASWRSEPEAPAPPSSPRPRRCSAAGDPARARELASGLLQDDTPPALRARIHHLLGWAALKEGEGRRALDEFSQVQNRPIEPQAVAAAFSLDRRRRPGHPPVGAGRTAEVGSDHPPRVGRSAHPPAGT